MKTAVGFPDDDNLPEGFRINPEELAKLPPEMQEALAAQLAEVDKSFKANPLLRFRPHEKQRTFFAPEADGSWPPMRAFFGGNRSGKTTAAILYLLIQVCPIDLLPAHLKPYRRWDGPIRARIVTPDLTSTLDGVVHDKIREWCPPAILKGGSFDRAFDKVQRVLKFKDGSFVQFNSSEQDREKLGGIALHIVIYDEEPRRDVRSECLTRLIDFDGEEIFAMTPFEGMAWMYDEIYEPWERGDLAPEDGRVVMVDMDDNPHLSEAGKKRALSQYAPQEREARKTGMFVSFSGLIYPTFHENVVPAIDRVPNGVEVFLGIDPGIRHMCAVLFAYLDFRDQLVVFDEIAAKDKTIGEVVAEIRLRQLRWGPEQEDGTRAPLKYRWAVIDPAAASRNNQTGRSDQSEFADHGVFTIPGQHDQRPGINRVKERLAVTGRLQICANCTELQREGKRYRWVMDTHRGENAPREAPVKKDDHLLDVLRYIVMQRPLKPAEELPAENETTKARMLREHLKRLRRPRRPAGVIGPGQFS